MSELLNPRWLLVINDEAEFAQSNFARGECFFNPDATVTELFNDGINYAECSRINKHGGLLISTADIKETEGDKTTFRNVEVRRIELEPGKTYRSINGSEYVEVETEETTGVDNG